MKYKKIDKVVRMVQRNYRELAFAVFAALTPHRQPTPKNGLRHFSALLYLSQPKEKTDIEAKYPTNLPHNFDKKLKFAKTAKEQKKLDEKIEQLGFTKIKYVGQSFKCNNKNLFENSSIQSHWRRGHWRNQKYGERLMLKKTIWIMPTIVNHEKGQPLQGHIYDLDKKTTNR